MTGNGVTLLRHIRAEKRRLFLAGVRTEAWARILLDLELAHADYAAFPVERRGWVVLSTWFRRAVLCSDVTKVRQHLFLLYSTQLGTAGLRLSEGWAAGAHSGLQATPPGRANHDGCGQLEGSLGRP
jgi:hypothetical protein